MKTRNVCLLGGSGFVGRYVTEALTKQGITVRVLTRMRERAKHLLVLPTVEVVEANVHNEAELVAQFHDCDAVINLIGVLHDGKGRESFAAVHMDIAHDVVNACIKAKVKRLLHMSALNADPEAPSQYLRSKGEAEVIVRAVMHKLAVTIFRPSVIFGPEDNFLNRFAALIKLFPIIPLASAHTRFQPVFVEDVAKVVVKSLDQISAHGNTYEICGPHVYTLRELMQFTSALIQKSRSIIDLPPAMAKLQASVLEIMPGKLLTQDNLRSMQVDSVCKCDFETQFGFIPTSLAAIAPRYLTGQTPRGRYQIFRHRAGRSLRH